MLEASPSESASRREQDADIPLRSVFSTLALPQRCDLRQVVGASPEQIKQKAEAGLKPYFPDVIVIVDNRQQRLLGYTCTNLGRPILEMIPRVLDEKPEVQLLKTHHSIAQLRSFALGFERQVLYLDLPSGRYSIVDAETLPGYAAAYEENCTRKRLLIRNTG